MFYESDEFDLFKIKHNDVSPSKGKLLLSVPFVQEDYFKKSVIYLTEHNSEGSFGFLLNKCSDYVLSDLLSDVPENDIPVNYGGPVEKDTLHYIHTLGDIIPESMHVKDGIYWGGDIDAIKDLITADKAGKEQIRFFIGYAGWAPNQLFDEIQSDIWLVSPADKEDAMHRFDPEFWRIAMRKLGPKYSYWTTFPDNPNLN